MQSLTPGSNVTIAPDGSGGFTIASFGGSDSTVFSTNFRRDSALANVRSEIAGAGYLTSEVDGSVSNEIDLDNHTGTISTPQIEDDAITLNKLSSGTAARLIGYGGSGNPVEISVTGNGVLSGSVLNIAGGAADGVAASASWDHANNQIDVSVASPGSDFSIDMQPVMDSVNAVLPSAGINETIYNDGTNWVANNILKIFSTEVRIAKPLFVEENGHGISIKDGDIGLKPLLNADTLTGRFTKMNIWQLNNQTSNVIKNQDAFLTVGAFNDSRAIAEFKNRDGNYKAGFYHGINNVSFRIADTTAVKHNLAANGDSYQIGNSSIGTTTVSASNRLFLNGRGIISGTGASNTLGASLLNFTNTTYGGTGINFFYEDDGDFHINDTGTGSNL